MTPSLPCSVGRALWSDNRHRGQNATPECPSREDELGEKTDQRPGAAGRTGFNSIDRSDLT